MTELIYLQQTQEQLPNFKKNQIRQVLEMLDQGDTIPFIARYRKEVTGNLDEVEIKSIADGYQEVEKLEKRKLTIVNAIEEQGKLTIDLKQRILQAKNLASLEDLYLPYKQKRRTKATIAKERGLEPLASLILLLPEKNLDDLAQDYVDEAQELPDLTAVYDGVHEILVENYSDEATLREWTRHFLEKKSQLASSVKNEDLDEKQVFSIYYEFQEPLKKIQDHQILAINRGEKLNILTVKLEFPDLWEDYYEKKLIKKNTTSEASELLRKAYRDAFKRFILPQLTREIRGNLTDRANTAAINLFGENLRNLLLVAPLKGQTILGFDPAFRTGAKLAVVDPSGKLLTTTVIYPVKPASAQKIEQAKLDLANLIEKYQVDTIAIGNGTASRESEQFVAEVLKTIKRPVFYTIVSEAGASVYSASEVARAEFPDLPVEKRSAISIARRLIDPLAELVKVEPQAIGVGQYQHDVSQKRLTEELDFVVETTVNQVGVDVNTASLELLKHISGLNQTTAKNLVNYRNEHGEFLDRINLKKVPRLGPKAYEQAVGFLKIIGGKNPLDQTMIHPESYDVCKKLFAEFNFTKADLGTEKLKQALQTINVQQLAQKLEVGEPTLVDIIAALKAPERDIRYDAPQPILRSDVLSFDDLVPKMKLRGTVRNVVDFGAFVDVGIKEDGLVHLSKMSKNYIKHPSDLLKVGDIVDVWVISVDKNKGRISLSMIEPK